MKDYFRKIDAEGRGVTYESGTFTGLKMLVWIQVAYGMRFCGQSNDVFFGPTTLEDLCPGSKLAGTGTRIPTAI